MLAQCNPHLCLVFSVDLHNYGSVKMQRDYLKCEIVFLGLPFCRN